MERNQLAVTLTPLNFKDPVERRVLTLSSDTDQIVIGRSSKEPTKDLKPAPNNAWFDSRVMSRSHAIITVCQQKEQVSVTDTKSMHGTWLNGTKLVSNNKTPLTNRDILTFGTKVTRGSETFQPLKVRLILSWTKEVKPTLVEAPKPIKRHSENTFVVPDDDDDNDDEDFNDPQAEAIFENTSDIEVLSREPSVAANSDVVSIHCSVEDGGQQAESSPPTSLLSKSEEKDDNSPRSNSVPPAASKPPCHSVVLANNEVTGNQGPERLVDVISRADSDVKTALPTPIESDSIYDADSAYERDQFSEEGPCSGSDSEGESLKFGIETETDSGSGQPRNNTNTDHTAKAGVSYSSASLKNTHSPFAVPEKHHWTHRYADKTTHPEFPRPATTQNVSKPADSDGNGYYAFISSSISGEQLSTVQPSALGYKPSQTEATQNRDRSLASCSQRASSPSDKALARPAIGDSHMSFSEDSSSARWAPAANKIERAFGNIGPLEPESSSAAAVGYGGLSSVITSGYDFPHLPPLRGPYSDGPFTASNQGDNSWLGGGDNARDQALAENTRDLYHFGSSFSSAPVYGPFSAGAYPNSLHSQSQSQSQPQPQWQDCQSICNVPPHQPQRKPANAIPKEPKPATSIPIANIVDVQVSEFNRPTNPLKRKAKEVEPEVEAINDFYNDNDNDSESIPDAQPREIVIPFLDPSSQITNIPTSKNESQNLPPILMTPPTSETGTAQHTPPQKKIKTDTPVSRGTENRTSFGRYAVSALLGAAVGGIGAVAALASLPPDFFN
ncbi:hypothetical protein EMCG_09409 [[Emmonsia] crescens]|uniref:FHA domain-containing protein n=1 Tax=[Emmonsia] crescens TaxID=73230 RepID=A0A0G2I2T8_9EURO|nr:hypothetical protein EMCG_09409 [Emmonsia crescens UAMH 3008]